MINNLALSLLGIRDSLILYAGRSESQLLDQSLITIGDFANTTTIRQSRFGMTYVHSLTPTSSINFSSTFQSASGSFSSSENKLKSLAVIYTAQLSKKIIFSSGLQKSFFSGDLNTSYNESRLFGRMSIRF